MRKLFTLLLTFALFTVTLTALAADPTPEAKAAALKARADAAMDARHYDEAIAGYTEAYQTFPDAALLYNRSRAHEARGEYPDAYADLEKFGATAGPELKARVPRLNELLSELKGKIATFQLTCNVNGARVLLGGRELGATPLAPIQVNAGKAKLEILAEGQFPWQRDLELTGGGTVSVDAVLKPKATNGVLAIKSDPVALVKVDGQPFGRTPTEGVVGAGTHQVDATADGYVDFSSQVVVDAGATKQLTLDLHRKKTLLTSPWFWTIVGVVVVGAAVGVTLALVLERSADRGDGFEPNQIGAPLRW
jgi:hypothetical protein